jgi:hypothetical protein
MKRIAIITGILVLAVLLCGCTQTLSPAAIPNDTVQPITSPPVNSSLWMTINPVGDIHIGDPIKISAATSLPENTEVTYQVYGSSTHCLKYRCTSNGEAVGITRVRRGQGGINATSFEVNTSEFRPDEFIILLSVENPAVSATALFNVLQPQNATRPPVADFFIGMHGNRTFTIGDFYDNSQNYPTSWNWSFGDGTYSSEPHAMHNFQKNGTYLVTLTVSNEVGSDTRSQMVEWPFPQPRFNNTT